MVVAIQTVPLDRPVAPFIQQCLRYQGVPRMGVRRHFSRRGGQCLYFAYPFQLLTMQC